MAPVDGDCSPESKCILQYGQASCSELNFWNGLIITDNDGRKGYKRRYNSTGNASEVLAKYSFCKDSYRTTDKHEWNKASPIEITSINSRKGKRTQASLRCHKVQPSQGCNLKCKTEKHSKCQKTNFEANYHRPRTPEIQNLVLLIAENWYNVKENYCTEKGCVVMLDWEKRPEKVVWKPEYTRTIRLGNHKSLDLLNPYGLITGVTSRVGITVIITMTMTKKLLF